MPDPAEGGTAPTPEALLDAVARAAEALGEDEGPLSPVRALAESLVAAEQRRRRSAEVLRALVPTLAQTLDIRDIFGQIASAAREIIPHDLLEMGILDEGLQHGRLYAVSEGDLQDIPPFQIPEALCPTIRSDFAIIRAMDFNPSGVIQGVLVTSDDPVPRPVEVALPVGRFDRQMELGVRSHLRVPVILQGEMVAALLFFSREIDVYRPEHAEAARRIADHVALALAHQRLADEQRRAAEERERAARLEARVEALTAELDSQGGRRLVGVSKRWRDTLALATKVAGTETTVLLTGESGTGKEVVARFLWRASPRSKGPFVALNCAALPEQLLESELFGSEKGAFTGATATRPGRIEQAAGGVLFLDEVGEMSLVVQAKLLRVLQEREFQRLGATRTLKTDVRIVAATNRDLATALARGEFREDLYYRLGVFEIRLPPLRERPEDIPPMLEAFVEEIGRQVGRPAAGVSRDARDKLLAYPWPGNVRELRNAVERAVILAEGGLITSEHLPMTIGHPGRPGSAANAQPSSNGNGGAFPPGGIDLEEVERDYVRKALEQAGNNRSRAARLLGLTRSQLYSRLEKYGL
jgi:transcriptional regulator with GAF, ATPase, and Fis domain